MNCNVIRSNIILILFSIILASNLLGQRTFGIKAGFNYSNFYDNSESKMASGLKVGIFNDFRIYKNLLISIGLEWSKEGAYIDDSIVFDGNHSYYSYDLKVVRGYLELPLYFGYKFSISDKFQLKPYAGFRYTLGYFADFSESSGKEWLGDTAPEDYEGIEPAWGRLPTEQKWGLLLGLELSYNNLLIFEISYNRFRDAAMNYETLTGIDYRIHYINFSLGVFLI